MTHLKSGLLATAALALSLTAAQAETWRMATKTTMESPEGQIFAHFAEKVAEYSDGDMTIQIFPNEQLGASDAVLEQLTSGVIQIYGEGYAFMNMWVPELSWTSPSFLFDDYDHWRRFMDSDLVQGWFAEAEEIAGVTVIGDPSALARGPYRALVSTEEITNYDQFQGIKLRLWPDQLAIASWSALGAETVTMGYTDVYQGLSTGMVEGLVTPITLVESMRFNEVAPHIAQLDEFWQSLGLIANLDALEALSEENRDAVMRAYEDTVPFSHEVINAAAEESVARMTEAGATFTTIDTAPFVDTMATFYADMAEAGELPEGLMETVDATRAAE